MLPDAMEPIRGSPDLMLELLAILTKRAGGRIVFGAAETLGPFNLVQSDCVDETGNHFFVLELIEEAAGNA